MTVTLAIDGMGGDSAPHIVVEALSLALPKYADLHIRLYGDAIQLRPLLTQYAIPESRLTLCATTEIVTSDTKPSAALRGFKDSSMRQAVMAVREKQAQGVVSAGNTGAYMVLAKVILGTLPGIDRPAITGIIPSLKGLKVMLDLGANLEIGLKNYVQFAVMGAAFSKVVLGVKNPTVGLLNVGSEELKGYPVLKEAHQILSENPTLANYYGFVEGDDINKGTVDVVVADGFSGNVALKTMQGIVKFITQLLKESFRSSLLAMIAGLLAKGAFNMMKTRIDPRLFNGAPFLGLNGVAVKSHGGMDAVGFASAIQVAYNMVKKDINGDISAHLEQSASILAEATALSGAN